MKLVQEDSRVDVEDLRLVLNAKLEIYTSQWIFAMGLVIALLLATIPLPSDATFLTVRVGLTFAAIVLFLSFRFLGDPEDRAARILHETDYLDAKEIAEKRNEP